MFASLRKILATACCLFVIAVAAAPRADQFERKRQHMIRQIDATYSMTAAEVGRESMSQRVRSVMGTVPRHEFVPTDELSRAYSNIPLPIGHGQTISQPYIVALMTDLLDLDEHDVVLEIGTGSGYQAAVLAALVSGVYTIEIIPELGDEAAARFRRLALGNIEARIGDGYFGWPEAAPFDAIMVTAAGDHIPPPLIEQLKPGGRMILPVGTGFLTQHLVLVDKADDGTLTTRQVLPVRFVPLTGGH